MQLKGFVYVIGNDELGVFKIGYSRHHPANRLRFLQVGSPVILRLVAFAYVANAPEEEKRLHERFTEQWVHSEWFRMSAGDLKDIEMTLTASKIAVKKISQPRTLSKQEARVVLTLEEQGRRKISRHEIIALLGTSAKAADNVIESLRVKGWFERIGWGQYALIPFEQGQIVESKDKRFGKGNGNARLVELPDTAGLEPVDRKVVGVGIPHRAPV
jgi:hypothetical protein